MISIQHLSKTVGDKTLFENISFKIGEGQKVGLVGPNGAGKTTLLKILVGLEEADSGSVLRQNEVIGYLPQKLEAAAHAEIGNYLQAALKESWAEYKIPQALAKVGLKNVPTRTLLTKLSGGQKMKVGLAAVLLNEPTTVLMDEPTNNLDLASLVWLERFIKNFPGKVLVISHDRFFLDQCVTKIIELDQFTHTIQEYGGNYSQYKEQKALRFGNLMDKFEEQHAKELKMKAWIAEKQEQLKYHQSKKVASQLQAMKTRFEREIERNRMDKPKEYHSFQVAELGKSLHEGKSIFTLRNFGLYQLFQIEELFVFGQDRIQLLGPNGIGKTTMLKAILGMHQFYTGQVELGPNIQLGYFSQEHELLDLNQQVIQAFLAKTKNHTEAQARQILGSFLFRKDKVFSQVRFLSEGEKARLILAILIHQKNDFLLLDEPTNHLDLESREVLAEALQNYEGGFLVVTHDRYFAQQIGLTRILKLG